MRLREMPPIVSVSDVEFILADTLSLSPPDISRRRPWRQFKSGSVVKRRLVACLTQSAIPVPSIVGLATVQMKRRDKRICDSIHL